MGVTVRIPAALRSYAGGESRVVVDAATVSAALGGLVERYPALRPHLFEDGGALRGFVNVYLGERDVRELGGMEAPVREGDTLLVVPSVAGGS